MQIDASVEKFRLRCLAKNCPWEPTPTWDINNKGKAQHDARQHITHTKHEVEITATWKMYEVPTIGPVQGGI